jgi:hypothetical protein
MTKTSPVLFEGPGSAFKARLPPTPGGWADRCAAFSGRLGLAATVGEKAKTGGANA